MTIDKVLDFLRSHPEIGSVEEFLPELPESHRSQYTMMHTSRSLQKATPSRPRVILYGNDAKLVIAFSGDPTDERFDSLEMIGVREDEAAFEFREVRFRDGVARISQRNPRTCLTCHTSDPRPNWDHYSTWTGAIGSDDDEFSRSDIGLQPKLRAFLEEAHRLPRYESLIEVKKGYETQGGRSRNVHNIVFTQRIAQHNFRRVVRLARATPDWAKYKYATLGLVWCANEISSFVPERLRPRFEGALKVASEYRYGAVSNIVPFLEARGIPASTWSMDFQPATGRVGFVTPGNHDLEFTGLIADGDSDLLPFFEVTDSSYRGAPSKHGRLKGYKCDELRARSLAALADET